LTVKAHRSAAWWHALLVVTLAAVPAAAQRTLADHIRAGQHATLAELRELLAIPNLASDSMGIRRNAHFLVSAMARRGLAPRLLESEGSPPAVFGEWRVPGATRTLVLYAHYDGQPVTREDWATDPWLPVMRTGVMSAGGAERPFPAAGEPIDPEWRVYARSASDDKAGVMAILAAVDALRAAGQRPTSNLLIFLDGEEERGSPHLEAMLRSNRALLGADAWIIIDGPVHQSGRRQLVFGVRGDFNVDLTVYGPSRPLHSGHYGNWAPNPAHRLARLLATMKDDQGRVLVPGWYDDVQPLSAAERADLAVLPVADDSIRRSLALGEVEQVAPTLGEALLMPSLNINGIRSGDVGTAARNVIPTHASAVLDLRLVRGNQHERQYRRLVDHVRAQGYHVVERDPTPEEVLAHPRVARLVKLPGAYNAMRSRMDTPLAQSLRAALQRLSPQPVLMVPSLGGSLPLSVITETLGTDAVVLPIANPDNNQHAENENLRLGNLWDGIAAVAAVMTMR
jgi:acetylornithine deacetylase/succinyl-diaminopimelate desuccinylase-like protein